MIMLPEGTMATEKMSVKERRKFLSRNSKERYLNASRSAKSAMLDAMETDTSLHRKHLVRLNELRRHPATQAQP